MSNKRNALGKGLKSLLEDANTNLETKQEVQAAYQSTLGSIANILLNNIEINPFQPRVEFNQDKLENLAESITTHGVVQPITVRKIGGDKFQLIVGERRLRAAKIAGLQEIPAYIRLANDQEMLEIALIENIQREDLNAMEIGINFKRLIEECTLTQDALAKRVGKDRSTITNYLRLLKLPPEIQLAIKKNELSMGHARALINLGKVDLQLTLYKKIIEQGLSVRQVEELARQYQDKKKSVKRDSSSTPLPLTYRKIQDNLSSYFETKVTVKHKKDGKGEISISYFSDDDLNRIIELIK